MRPSVVRMALTFRCGVILISCIWWMALAVEVEVDPAWDNIFRTRNDDDWRAVWHTERHRRCYHDLLVHMDWVCQKDIYAVKRKKRFSSPYSNAHPPGLTNQGGWFGDQPPGDREEDDWYPFLEPEQAHNFLGSMSSTRRRRNGSHDLYKRGIIDECCHATVGCSWEEYAEYCPANSRLRT